MDMQGSSLLTIDVTACLCTEDNIFNSNTIVASYGNATLTT